MPNEDQLIPGPGHGYIEHPFFFGRPFPAKFRFNAAPDEGRIKHSPRRIILLKADSQLIMEENRFLQILAVEFFSHVGDDDDGEFEPLALMNAHDTDDVFFFTDDLSRRQIESVFHHLIDELQIAEKTAESGIFVLLCPVIEGLQVGLTKVTAGHGADEVDVGRIGIKPLNKFSNALATTVGAPFFKMADKIIDICFQRIRLVKGVGKGRQILPQRLVAHKAQFG